MVCILSTCGQKGDRLVKSGGTIAEILVQGKTLYLCMKLLLYIRCLKERFQATAESSALYQYLSSIILRLFFEEDVSEEKRLVGRPRSTWWEDNVQEDAIDVLYTRNWKSSFTK
jgi:hypothetical protein